MNKKKNSKEYFKKTLSNGLRLMVVPMDTPTVTVAVLVEAGSKYETKSQNGLSHFLEHMCFKGTEKRPSIKDISHALDSIGAEYNAFTSQEYTSYYAKGSARHFDTLLDVVSDIYINSTLPDNDIEKEKGVIVEEINMYEDLPMRNVYDTFLSLVYGDQPAGWEIIGSRENVRSFTRKDFVSYKKQHYVAKGTLVVVAGGVDPKETLAQMTKAFKSISTGPKKGKKKTIDSQNTPQVRVKFKKTDQAHCVLGYRAFSLHEEKKLPALAVLDGILSGGMSSRLWQLLREDLGVCYYVRSHNDPYTDHGVFAITAGVDVNRVEEVLTLIQSECMRLVNDKVSDAELSKVKQYLIGSLTLGYESTEAVLYYWAQQELFRKSLKGIDEVSKIIMKVTAEDIQNLAREIFNPKHANFAVIGPYKDEKKFLKILKV